MGVPKKLQGPTLNIGTDKDTTLLAIEQNDPVDNPLVETAEMVVAILRALKGILSKDTLDDLKSKREDISLSQLAMGLRSHDGIFGICFEHAIHYGVMNKIKPMYDYVSAALRNMFGWDWPIESVMFGIEKCDYDLFLNNIDHHFGDDPLLVTSQNFYTPLTRELFINLRKPTKRHKLPQNLQGLYKTDLFWGSREQQRWTSVTVKSRDKNVESSPGLALAIYPYTGSKDEEAVRFMVSNDFYHTQHLVIPLDDKFMNYFHSAYFLVQDLIRTRFEPPPAQSPYAQPQKYIGNFLANRRKDRIIDVEDALKKDVGANASKGIYLSRWSGWIIPSNEARDGSPDDIERDLLVSALPRYRESLHLNNILDVRL